MLTPTALYLVPPVVAIERQTAHRGLPQQTGRAVQCGSGVGYETMMALSSEFLSVDLSGRPDGRLVGL